MATFFHGFSDGLQSCPVVCADTKKPLHRHEVLFAEVLHHLFGLLSTREGPIIPRSGSAEEIGPALASPP